MKVRIEHADVFRNAFDVYFYEETPGGTFVYHTRQNDDGTIWWSRDHAPDGARVAPTLQVTQPMLDALREAMDPMAVKVDEELVRRLKLEESPRRHAHQVQYHHCRAEDLK